MLRTPALCLLVAVTLAMSAPFAAAEAPATQPAEAQQLPPGQWQQSFSKEITRTVESDYLLYLPRAYASEENKAKKWPMILFLHGSGARGGNLAMLRFQALPRKVDRDQDFPFVVVSPQCPTGEFWDVTTLKALVDHVIATHNVDPDRVYLTGLSLGAFGAWNLVSAHPELFAACAPVCGGGGDPAAAPKLRGVPFWVFHGEDDKVVPIMHSRVMVNALRAAGVEVKFTTYNNVGHGSWERTYANPELYEWFLKHKRKPR